MPEPTAIDSIRYFGDYLILGEIARGGMGVVYLARQTSLNREVALKLIRTGALATRRDIELFRIEAEAAASLSHSHIVRIFESGEHDSQPFVAMEWIDGASLAEQLTDGRWKFNHTSARARQRTIAELLRTLAGAVHHAHQRGIIHRDLKPSNVLLNTKGEPFLTDFGIAKLIEGGTGLTHTGQLLGTPSYMSPEQAAGKAKDVTVATDVYGLGAILYAMLTGSPPFRGATDLETLDQVRHNEPTTPRSANGAIDTDLETICLKCLEKEPARRYSSAFALQEDLDRWLRGEPIAARPVSGLERARKWVRRHPVTTALSAAVLVCLLVGGLAVTWQWRRAEQGWSAVRQANTRLQLQRAEEQFARDDSRAAFATLARTLRDEPRNRVVEERLVNALRVRRFLVPTANSSTPFDLSGNPQTLARRSQRGSVVADASNGTNIVITGQPFSDGPFTLVPPTMGIIRHVTVSPDTHWVGAAVSDAGVCVWDVRSRKLMGTFPHSAAATAVEFDPAAFFIATGADDGVVRLWDLRQNTPTGIISAHRVPINALCFTDDGRVLFSAGEDGVIRAHYPGRAKVAAEPLQAGGAIDGLAVGRGNVLSARLRGNSVRQFALPKFPSLRELAVVDPSLVDQARPNLLSIDFILGRAATNFHAQSIACTNLSPDGCFLVTASMDGTARVWDAKSGAAKSPPMVHAATVNHVRFSPDGLSLATSTEDQRVRVWDAATGSALTDSLETPNSVFSVRFSSDGRSVIASNGQQWRLHQHSTEAPEWLTGLAEAVAGARISTSGVVEAIAPGEVADFFRHFNHRSLDHDRWGWLQTILPVP